VIWRNCAGPIGQPACHVAPSCAAVTALVVATNAGTAVALFGGAAWVAPGVGGTALDGTSVAGADTAASVGEAPVCRTSVAGADAGACVGEAVAGEAVADRAALGREMAASRVTASDVALPAWPPDVQAVRQALVTTQIETAIETAGRRIGSA